MVAPACTEEEFIRIWHECEGSASKVARHIGVTERRVHDRRRYIEGRRGITLPTHIAPQQPAPTAAIPAPGAEVERLQDRLRELQARLATAEKASLSDEYVKRKIFELLEGPIDPPKWLTPTRVPRGGLLVPTLMLSDLHWGEVVYPRQVNGVNEYNIAVAQRRFRTAIERAVDLCKHHMIEPNYPGIVVALGGDMLSGDIHEELSESNELPVMPALLDLMGCLIWAIGRLADEFGRVFLPCVTGNHGRNTKKPRAKGRNYSNFDWLLYQFLAKHFEADKRIQFLIPDGSDAHWTVFGHRYCMTHGDQFRGGDGMIGALGPIIRGDHKKRSRNGQIDLGYDTLLLGHWHQLIQLQRLIVNGSLKGYDEYAAANNFGFEQPQQALWLTHSERGITFSMPVHVDERRHVENTKWLEFAA
jgi:transposase-like protein